MTRITAIRKDSLLSKHTIMLTTDGRGILECSPTEMDLSLKPRGGGNLIVTLYRLKSSHLNRFICIRVQKECIFYVCKKNVSSIRWILFRYLIATHSIKKNLIWAKIWLQHMYLYIAFTIVIQTRETHTHETSTIQRMCDYFF